MKRGAVPVVLQQHAAEVGHLRLVRGVQVTGSNIRLHHLARLDERIAAHLDGLLVAGEQGWNCSATDLESPAVGNLFGTTVLALESKQPQRIQHLAAVAEAAPQACGGFLSAFGWVPAPRLQGVVAALLASDVPFRRYAGLAACSMHRVDPGLASARWMEDPNPVVRARSWRITGELGKRERVSSAASASSDEDPACQFWAAWSAVLLGDKRNALEKLVQIASGPHPFRLRALQLALQALGLSAAHEVLKPMALDPAALRTLIRSTGWVGDPAYVRWLIDFMANDPFARLAGEAFSLLTGVDLAREGLERRPPEGFESGPNDDPNAADVGLDEDDGLPWPDRDRVHTWWNANAQRFQTGVRTFMGEPLNRENCIRVLKAGYQRQRISAALYLALLDPGTPLFEWRAPAGRQQTLLARMS